MFAAGWGGVYVADEEIAGIGLLAFKVVVGLKGAWAGTYHYGWKPELPGVHGAHGVGCDDESGNVGEREMYDKEE